MKLKCKCKYTEQSFIKENSNKVIILQTDQSTEEICVCVCVDHIIHFKWNKNCFQFCTPFRGSEVSIISPDPPKKRRKSSNLAEEGRASSEI